MNKCLSKQIPFSHILLASKRYEEERRELETQVGEQNMTVGNLLGKTMSKMHNLLINYLKSTEISEII